MKPLLLFVVVPLVLVTIIDLLARRIRKSARQPPTGTGSSGQPEADTNPRAGDRASALQRDPELLAAKALQAIARILELTTKVTAVDAERAAHEAEAKECILALIAAIVIADGVVHPGEHKYLARLASNLDTPEQCRAFVDRYAEAWNSMRASTPRYFQAVAAHDRATGTRLGAEIITGLRSVIWYTALADGDYRDEEVAIGTAHLTALYAVFHDAVWVVQWDASSAPPPVRIENTVRRDDFSKRGVW